MKTITLANIADFSYARRSHFAHLRARRLFERRFVSMNPLDPETCDLKVYQDHLAYRFLRDSLRRGARVLEVGGGDSRVLKHLARRFECWNVDRCEGLGNGPVAFSSPHYRMVYDYLGNGNPELPARYFDCVFSISALEHMPETPAAFVSFLADLRRVLRPGGLALHLFDVVLRRRPGHHFFHGLISYLGDHAPVRTRRVEAEDLLRDPDLYSMSRSAFDRTWAPFVQQSYDVHGLPSSVTVAWAEP